MRWIRCTIDPQINRITRINHANSTRTGGRRRAAASPTGARRRAAATPVAAATPIPGVPAVPGREPRPFGMNHALTYGMPSALGGRTLPTSPATTMITTT